MGKSVAVVAPVLLLLHDFLAHRRPRWPVLAAGVATVLALLVHVRVGRSVEMMTAWPGGSRLTALATMGPVWLRYLANASFPSVSPSITTSRSAARAIRWPGCATRCWPRWSSSVFAPPARTACGPGRSAGS